MRGRHHDRRGRGTFAAAVMATALLLDACKVPAPTARSGADYRKKAGHTADDVHSAVETALLAMDNDRRGGVFGPTLAVIVSGAESQADGAASTFDAIQPEGASSDQTRSELLELLDAATGALADVRIAVRRGDAAKARASEPALRRLAKALGDFANAQG